MLEPVYTKSFGKEQKLMGKRGRDLDKLGEVMRMIINEQPLPPQYENHPLHGEWKDSLECHIQGDWVLVYKINDAARKVTFYHTGSHSDLF
ncbi:MAG: type II toxin-antitoxin system YafQ family toxin [Treponema sp.]|jgi:mRNA interferase YafQ|nr:type II toxin-antitoxin system YafQ family toxin [Treponema sp.]